MNLKKLIKNAGALILLVTVFNSYCQEGIPVYHDYLSDNYYLVYPSMAGVGRQGGKVRLTARKQWFDVEGAPNLQTLNGHLRVGERSGVGIILYRDENGYHSQGGVKLTYAHHLSFATNSVDLNQLSFGLSAGYLQSSLDESEFVSLVPDPEVTGTNNSSGYYNVDIGASYHFMDFYMHVAAQNILGTKRDLYSGRELKNLRKYLVSLGQTFDIDADWDIEPSVLFQLSEFTKEAAADVNVKAYYSLSETARLWGGLSYRRSLQGAQYDIGDGGLETEKLQMITPILGITVNNFMVAYTYSYQLGDIRFDDGGFHQITLGYDFWQGSEPYECNCPAANY